MKIILTGATGMVGEGVLIECLNHSEVEKVLSVSRRRSGYAHEKLEEFIVSDFFELTLDEENLNGYDACFYCAGVSSVGMDEETYRHITYDTTIHFANVVQQQNPDSVFIYVTGAGTDSSESGRLMWARVKGKTENDLMNMNFKDVFNFRPAFMKATAGQKRLPTAYKLAGWLYPVVKIIYPRGVCTLKQLGQAMIKAVLNGYEKQVLEVVDIKTLADR